MIRILFACLCFVELMALQEENQLYLNFFTPEISSVSIEDWQNPSTNEYVKLQTFIKERHVQHIEDSSFRYSTFKDLFPLEFYGWLLYRSGRIAFVKDTQETSGMHIFYGNTDPHQKNRCIICYAGYSSKWNDRDYQRGIEWILASLKKFNFDGHFLYYIGGWPSLKKNRLKWIDVPFAFKPFLFEEARDLGYKQILWIDACCIPVQSLNPIFDQIQNSGLCFYSYESPLQWRPFTNGYKYLMPFLHLSEQCSYEQISSQIVGLDVSNPVASSLLDAWILSAEKKVPFLQSDEPPFMYLVNHLHLEYGRMPQQFYIETPCNTGKFNYWTQNPQAIIYHQYDFLSPQYEVPQDLFEHGKAL